MRCETHELGVNPKLIDQSDGPYQVVANDKNTLLLRVGTDLIRVSSDRITSAPSPPSGKQCLPFSRESSRCTLVGE